MFEAYKVAVKISLIDGVSAGVLGIAGAFTRAHGDAELLQKRIDRLKFPALASGALFGAGAIGLHTLLKHPLEEAAKYQMELAKFETLGFGEHINRQADIAAKGMKTVGVSASENMALLTDSMAVFKDFHEASMAAPIIAKMKFANEILFHDQGGARDSKLMDMLKVGELRGATKSVEAMERQAEFAQKVIEGSRNRVDPTQMLNAMKYGGIATRMMSDKAFYLRSEPLIQEVGGAGFGTGMSALYSNLAQGRGSLTAQQELYRLDLMDKPKVQFNSLGMLKKALPGAFKGEASFKDGIEGVGNLLLEAFKKKGITSDEDVIREIGMVASNQRGARLLTTWYQQREKMAMQADANEHAMGLSEAVDKASKTYDGQKIALGKSWNNLMLVLGENILPLAIKGLELLNPMLERLNHFMREHGTIVKVLAIGFGGLAIAATVAGSLGLLGVAISGLQIALGAGAIAATLGGLATGIRLFTGAAMFGLRGLGMGIMFLGRALLLNPIGLVITGIVAAIYGLYTYWGKIKSWLPSWMTGGNDGGNGGGSGGVTGVKIDAVRSSQQALQVHVHNTVDEHGIASMVTRYQGNWADRPQHGLSGHDGRMSMISPTLAGAGG